jgi:hypothetical protein
LQDLRLSLGQAVAGIIAILLTQRIDRAAQLRGFALRNAVAAIGPLDTPFELFDLRADGVGLPAIVPAVLTIIVAVAIVVTVAIIIAIVVTLVVRVALRPALGLGRGDGSERGAADEGGDDEPVGLAHG